MSILLVIAILVLLIVAHELGHFFAAKFFKVRVDEFGIGYPPRAYTFGKWGGTEYTLNWLPFGGFVRLFGEDDPESTARGNLAKQAPWKQAIILVAGVVANVLVAYLLFAVAFTQGVPRIVDQGEGGPGAKLFVSDIVDGSPADAGGLRAGDEIISVELKGATPTSLAPQDVTDFVKERGGKDISILYKRAGVENTVVVRPANAVVPGEEGRPALGVGLVLVSTESMGVKDAFITAGTTLKNSSIYVVESVWSILWDSIRGKADISQVVGPVGLVGVIGDAARSGAGYVLQLAGFISINLAVVNLIPIPALDGGRLAVIGYEAVTRRKSSRLAVQLLNTIGIALIILLMVVVTYQDIGRLLS